MQTHENQGDKMNSEDDSTLPKRIKVSNDPILNLQEEKLDDEQVLNFNVQSGSESTSFEFCKIMQEEISNDNVRSSLEKKDSMGLEEMLMCNICCDIMYNCMSIRPCLHTFCGGCLFDCMDSGDICPMCRGHIDGISKNHILINIVNKFLEKNPEKMKSQSERTEADIKVANGMKKMDETKSFVMESTSSNSLELYGCPYCNYPNTSNTNVSHVDLSEASLPNFECTPLTNHIQCQCCHIFIPDLIEAEQYPKQKCQICNKISCSLLLNGCRGCITGCLYIFKDFILNPNLNSNTQVPVFLPENFFETSILRNYLNSQNLTVMDMFKDCSDKSFRGEFQMEYSVNVSTALCLHCSRKLVLDMVFEYSRNIPKSCLPATVTSRPNCFYGRNCRTQRTREHHAKNYNHVCPQTKF